MHGQKILVAIGRAKVPLEKIPFDNLTEFGRDNFISQATMRRFRAFLGENEVNIEAGLQDELVRQNHTLEKYYHVKGLEFLIDKSQAHLL